MKFTVANKCNAPPSFITAIETATEQFISLGCDLITEACNKKRECHWKKASEMDAKEMYLKSGFDAGTVYCELRPPFELCFPGTIPFQVLPGRSKNHPKAAAEYDEITGIVHVFFEHFEESIDHWHVRGKESWRLDAVIWHELLHACGDLPSRGRVDGMIRHQVCGTEVIRDLSRQQGA